MKLFNRILVASAAFAACVWVSVTPSGAVAQEDDLGDGPPPVVAVMDITQDGAGLSSASLKRMSEYLLSRVTAGGQYMVVPRDQVTNALVAQKVKAQEPCYGSCHVKLANALAASKVLHAKFMKIGKRCSLILDLYDVQTETMENSVEADKLACTETGLKDGISTAAAKLSGRFVVEPVPVDGTGGQTVAPGVQPVPVSRDSSSNSGTLNISGTPDGALVEISGPAEFGRNGRASARLPVSGMRVPPGNYKVSVAAKDYETAQRTVWVYPGAVAELSVTLEYGFGQIELTGGPAGVQGQVTCADGAPMNVALPGEGSTIRLTVPRGECRVSFDTDDYRFSDRTVDITGGGIVAVKVEALRNYSLKSEGGVLSSGSVGSYGGERYAYFANDGDRSTIWANSWSMQDWLLLTMSEPHLIDSVVLRLHAHRQKYRIDISEDGRNWRTVVTPTWSENREGQNTVQSHKINPTRAKYLKVVFLDSEAPSSHIFKYCVYELEVWAH